MTEYPKLSVLQRVELIITEMEDAGIHGSPFDNKENAPEIGLTKKNFEELFKKGGTVGYFYKGLKVYKITKLKK